MYLEDKIGTTHEAVITGIQEYGIFVEIASTKSEGLIRLNEIDGDTWQAEVQKHRVVGFNTNQKLNLGDKVFVSITSVDMERKTIGFKLYL